MYVKMVDKYNTLAHYVELQLCVNESFFSL